MTKFKIEIQIAGKGNGWMVIIRDAGNWFEAWRKAEFFQKLGLRTRTSRAN